MPALRPRIQIYPHTDCREIPLEPLTEQANRAIPWCLDSCGTEPPLLGGFEDVEINIISDIAIAELHGEYMDDPSPTDVITFHHGEIFVSLDTARREASSHGNSVTDEVLLYIIHGLLHLNGHTDLQDPERARMHHDQEVILRRVTARSGEDSAAI